MWLDTIIVIAVICVGIVIFYKALQAPLDLLFGLIWRGLVAIKDGITNAGEKGSDKYEEIRYG